MNRAAAVARWVAIALVAAFVVVVIVSQWRRLPEIDWRLRPGWLALSLAALLAFQWMHIELWRSMLAALGSPIGASRGRAIWSTTLLARYVPTSVLMAVGRIQLAEKEGVPRRVSLASVVYELALAFITALSLSTYLVVTLDEFEGYGWRWLVLAVPVVGLAVLHPRVFHHVADLALTRLGRQRLPISLSFTAVLRYAAGFALSFVVAGVAVYAMTEALHGLATADAPTAVASYSLGFAAGVVAFVLPGALGAREAGVVVALSAVVPTTVALAVAVVLRLAQIGVELLYAGVTPLLARRA